MRFPLHMVGSCQQQWAGRGVTAAALQNHRVPSTSQKSCRVGAGRPRIRVHRSVYIRSHHVYQSDIKLVRCTIHVTVFCVQRKYKENGRVCSRPQFNRILHCPFKQRDLLGSQRHVEYVYAVELCWLRKNYISWILQVRQEWDQNNSY